MALAAQLGEDLLCDVVPDVSGGAAQAFAVLLPGLGGVVVGLVERTPRRRLEAVCVVGQREHRGEATAVVFYLNRHQRASFEEATASPTRTVVPVVSAS